MCAHVYVWVNALGNYWSPHKRLPDWSDGAPYLKEVDQDNQEAFVCCQMHIGWQLLTLSANKRTCTKEQTKPDEDGYNLLLKQLMFILSLVPIYNIPYFLSVLHAGIL